MNILRRFIVSLLIVLAAVSGAVLHAAVAPDLDNVIAYPNPMNVARGETAINFDNLTGDVRLRVYKATGESVFDKSMTAAAGKVVWSPVNNDGYDLAPGLYLYYITNTAGQKAKGKVAIIR